MRSDKELLRWPRNVSAATGRPRSRSIPRSLTIEDAIALNPVDDFSEVWVVPAAGSDATGFNGRDAIVMHESDFNPERVLLDLELVDVLPGIEAGARIGTATGVLDYAFGNFRIQVTRLGEERGVTEPDRLSIGSYNVENLDPVIEDRALVQGDADVDDDDVGEGKFVAIAEQIVADLGAPAILALQEIQDNDGAERTPRRRR